jgi:hypothetical protein
MDYSYIFRRAFTITWNYRALWVLGILLAGTAGSMSRGSSSSVNFSFRELPNIPEMPWILPRAPMIPDYILNMLLTIGIVMICLFFLLGIAAAVIRYISETGAIRMVNRFEANGERVRVWEGFRLGWSVRAFRVFVIDLMFSILIFVIAVLLLLFAASPLVLWMLENNTAGIIGTVIAAGLFLIVLLVLFLIAAAYTLFSQFFRRAAIMENLGIFEAVGRGYSLVTRRLGQVILVGILLFIISILWGILMIPVLVGILLSAGILGALPGLLAGWAATFFTEGDAPYIIGIIFGLPTFIVAFLGPLLWLNGLYEVFNLSAWTLAYRQAVGLEGQLSPSTKIVS